MVSSQQGGSFLASQQFISVEIQGAEELGNAYGFPWEYVFSQMTGAECGACVYAQYPQPYGPGDPTSTQNCFNWWSYTVGGPENVGGGFTTPPGGVEAEYVSGLGWRCYNPSDFGGSYDMYDFNVKPGPPGGTGDTINTALLSLQAATTGPLGITNYYASNLGVCYNGFCGRQIEDTCDFGTWAGGTYAIGRPGGGEG